MSQFQSKYNQAKKKEVMIQIPKIQQEIVELQNAMRTTTNADAKKALKARIDALNIKIQSYRKGDPVKEEAQAAISTLSVGSPTMTDGDGETVPATYGSSHIHPSHTGTISRTAEWKAPKHNQKKNKKKKKLKEFVEFYFTEEDKVPYETEIKNLLIKAKKEKNAEKVVFYSQALNKSASVSFDRFKGSSVYDSWVKSNANEIQKVKDEFKRFSYM